MPHPPFDDTYTEVSTDIFQPTRNGIDTSEIDEFRQGVEITNEKARYAGGLPKFQVGNNPYRTLPRNNQYQILTFGIAMSVSKATDEIAFTDNHGRFDPVAYIQNREFYPFPIYIGDGREADFICRIERFKIPDLTKEWNTDFPFFSKRIFGYLAEGNQNPFKPESSDRIQQFIYHNNNFVPEYYFDSGLNTELGITREGMVSFYQSKIKPFDDTQSVQTTTTDTKLIDTLNLSPEMRNVLLTQLSVNNDDSFIPNNAKSLTAGFTYGTYESSRTGTDSVAFGGYIYDNS